ncbi:MAG: helix-turn-helix domain-containing protein, partial [Eubacteriales bacterium]|nr:helix-turn-helix domain-containing protein [Eubacteriales bacterium]
KPDYYDTIEGQHNNILYFVLNVPEERKLLPAANLVIINDPIDSTNLFQIVDDFIHRNFRIDNAYSRIGQHILSGKSLDELLEIGSRLINNPIVLLDISTKAICYSSIEDFEKLDDELLQSVVKNGFVTSELFEKYDYETLLPFIGSMEKSQIFYSKYKTKRNRVTARVMVNNKYFGMLVIPEMWTELTEDDPAIADIIANGVSILLEKQKVRTVNDNKENIFLELLSDSFAGEKEFRERTGGFSWNPEFPIRIVAIHTRNKKYSQSVRVWMEHRNLNQAAKALDIHRNTMVYRLEKFESITGLDLSSGEAIYRLNLAYHLWDLRNYKVNED